MITSTDTDQIIGPWIAVLTELGQVAKDQTGHHGTYATINSVLHTIKPILAAAGLAVQQSCELSDTGVVITTRVWHGSGQWIEDGGLRMPAPNDPQKVGGSVTYGRRYALLTFFALGTVDDDAAGAVLGIAEDEEARIVAALLEQRVLSCWARMVKLSDEGKQVLKSAVFDEFQIAELHKADLFEDAELLGFVESKVKEVQS